MGGDIMVNADWVPTAITGATGILGACVGVLGSIVAGNQQMRSQQQLAMLKNPLPRVTDGFRYTTKYSKFTPNTRCFILM